MIQRQETNGLSIASLVLGIVWLGGLGSILAVIFGFISRKQIRNSNGRQTGDGLSIAGIILGFLGIAGLILWIVLIAVLATTVDHFHCYGSTNNGTYHCTTTGNSGNTQDFPGNSGDGGNSGLGNSSNSGLGNSGNSGFVALGSNSNSGVSGTQTLVP